MKNFRAKLDFDTTIIASDGQLEIFTNRTEKFAKADVHILAYKLRSYGRIDDKHVDGLLSLISGNTM